MVYNENLWLERNQSRIDITTNITHLTRSAFVGGVQVSPIDILIKILIEKKILGSTTESGFIIGNTPAVCFMEAPPYSICQNIEFERDLVHRKLSTKVRYDSFGLMFPKKYIFKRGGRPVFYEKTDRAKKLLKEDEWWRIVNYDLSDENNIIDWTHEREWRIPGPFEFDLSEVTVLVPNYKIYQAFHKKVSGECKDILEEIRCVTSLGSLFI